MVPFQDFLPLSTEVLPLETLSAHSSHWKEEAKQGSILPETFPTPGAGGDPDVEEIWSELRATPSPYPLFITVCVAF